MSPMQNSDGEAAYITIVEGPPPDFSAVNKHWTASLAEGMDWSVVATCQMRTLDGKALVERCQGAWREGRPAYLDYPRPTEDVVLSLGRAAAQIVAAKWEEVPEGQLLTLWVRSDKLDDLGLEEVL
jgi:hypothetical protein